MIILRNIVSWSSPDILDIPFKIIIYFTLINSLDKFEFGLLNIAMMIFSYQAIAQFGVVDWLLFELPRRYSLKQKIEVLISQSYTFVFINQLIILMLVFICTLVFGENSLFFQFSCIVYIVHTIFYNIYLHKKTYLRFNHKFSHLLNVQLIYVILKFILQFCALKFYGIYLFLIVEMVIFLIPIYLFRFNASFLLFDSNWKKNYKFLFFNGLPFFAVIVISTILGNLDRWYVVGVFGVEKFATYSVGVFIVTGLMIFPGKVLSIFVQYMREMYTLDKNTSTNLSRSFSIFNILIYLLFLIIIFFYWGKSYITIFLPNYSDVIPLVDIFLLSAFLKFAVSLITNLLYLIDQRAYVVKIQILTLLTYVIALSLNLYFNLDINYVILSICFVSLIQIFISILILIKFETIIKKIELIKFIFLIIMPTIYFSVSLFTGNHIPIFIATIFMTLVFFVKLKITWNNFIHIATRKFI